MKVIFLTGSHPRHLYIAKKLLDEKLLSGLVIEQRESFVPKPPNDLHEVDHKNFVRHFKERDETENKFFSDIQIEHFQAVPMMKITKDELNSEKVKEWLLERKPDVVISYGIHKLEQNILDILPDMSWNIHGGLSPWFRGNVTLFWPFYFLKPNWAGMTIHKLTKKLDGGEIVHHSVPKLEYGDGVHDVACKAVLQVSNDIVEILKAVKDGFEVTYHPQKTAGKLFVSDDWKPQHLRFIYNTYNNDIVDEFLKGNIKSDAPPLVHWLDSNNS